MRYLWGILILVAALPCSCIRDEAMNDEADILSVSFSDGCLRAKKPEIGNDYIFVFPKKHVSLRDSALTAIELTPGASYQRIAHTAVSDTLFFLDVTSQSGRYVKRYPVIASYFPSVFDFESWATPTVGYLYENPKEGSLQWFSSNNGAAIAWNNPARLAADYPIRRAVRALSGASAVELRTMKGPGHIFGTIDVPCMSGSLYLGGFNPLTGLTNPLHSTRFGVPFSDGRPVKLTGYYIYKEGEGDYINPDGSTTANRRDTCAIYAVLFKTDSDTQYLYGDDIATSPNIIARAELSPDDVRISPDFTRFEIAFNYAPYTVPFSFAELYNDEYKITIVFASSHKGDTYEGRIGNTLIIDRLELEYEDENGH